MVGVGTWAGCSDGEIGVEGLVDESRGEEARRVRERKRRVRRFDQVRMNVLSLVAVFEDEVLEEGVCRKWG